MIPNHYSNKSLSNMELVATVNSSAEPLLIKELLKIPETAPIVATGLTIVIVIYAIAKSIAIVIDSWHKRK